MAAGTLAAMDVGANIVIGGLAVQLLFFGFFVIVAAIFHWRAKKNEHYAYAISHSNESTTSSSAVKTKLTWESLMWGLYVACLLILVRSIFRVVEFVEGNDGSIMRREYLLYIFDACLMTLAGVVLSLVFPGFLLKDDNPERSSMIQLVSSGGAFSRMKTESA